MGFSHLTKQNVRESYILGQTFIMQIRSFNNASEDFNVKQTRGLKGYKTT